MGELERKAALVRYQAISVTGVANLRAPTIESQPLPNVFVSGNSRTSATNFASNGRTLSLRHTSANGKGKCKSMTDSKTTPSGHRQRVAPLTCQGSQNCGRRDRP